MKGHVVILFLSLIVLDFVCAIPRIQFQSRSQALKKDEENTNAARPNAILRAPDSSEAIADEGQNEPKDGDFQVIEKERPLKVGDTFTARELLPVAIKLFEKVEHKGEGKGFVTSAKRPEDLADKLFQDFFMTTSRIVTLRDVDIAGLNALQSLALAGEPASRTKFAERTQEKKEIKVIEHNGQRIEIDEQAGNTSRYKVLSKKTIVRVPRNNTKQMGVNRRGSNKLIKRLGRNRHLVVQRKNMNNKKRKNKPPCRWSYECKNPVDLDSCRLKAKCTPRKPDEKVDHTQYINSKLDIDPNIVKQFRKALAISALDEEVEKILENRVFQFRPKNLESSEKIESLSEYFHKIMNAGSKSESAVTIPLQYEDDYVDTENGPEGNVGLPDNQITERNTTKKRKTTKMTTTTKRRKKPKKKRP